MTNSVHTKYYNFDEFIEGRHQKDEKAQIPHLYNKIYEKARAKKNPIILELGTHRGMSTLMFFQAVKEKGGHVYSVDIDDQYSDLTKSSDWTFIHSNSTSVKDIVENHAQLAKGIDILLIDSLHTKEHVSKEFWGWEPYLNKDALIVFDDIDSHIYRPGARKDHIFLEFDWDHIKNFVEEVFYANEETLFLEMHFGSTGFAVLTKRTERTCRLKKNKPMKRRTDKLFWKLFVNIVKGIKKLKNG